ncbi:hypothetical protein Q9R32_12995 [Actinotalea sp. AC32]|nr:hypothetical protein [Actinotalea sp. AC32]
MGRGDEARVVAAFCRWLASEGWTEIETEKAYCDVVARRDRVRLFAEVKGRTSSPGLDVDTLYGQLLRRAPVVDEADVRLGVVIPVGLRAAALRVPATTRGSLRISVFLVDDSGAVTVIAPGTGPDRMEGT